MSNGSFELSATWSYSSGFTTTPGMELKQPAYNLLAASLQFIGPDKRYYCKLWGSNLTNEQVAMNLTLSSNWQRRRPVGTPDVRHHSRTKLPLRRVNNMVMKDGTPTQRASEWLAALASALVRGDAAGAAALFGDDGYWRDLVSFSWNITTAEGNARLRQMIEGAVIPAKPSGWQLEGEAGETDGVTEGWIRFETAVARGYGHLRLNGGKAWTLLTTMTELKGYEEHKGPTRDMGTEHVARRGSKTWLEQRQQEEADLGVTTQPYVVIVGGGQGGIALAARLRRLNVPTIIVEKNERPGDSWRKRYKSLCLHDPVWYDHLPYIPFPEHWPVFSPKDKIADWLEMYTKVMELNYWGSTECKGARYDDSRKEWTVEVVRNGKPMTLRPKQLVLATGGSGFPNMPSVPGMDKFKGDLQHSSEHPGPEGYKGKKAVVIGSNSSGHDICVALWEEGADVTMVQRSSTLVGRSQSLGALTLDSLYSETAVKAGITTDKADLLMASTPYKELPTIACSCLREAPAGRRGLLREAGEGRLHARLRRGWLGPLPEGHARRRRLLHRHRRQRSHHRRPGQAQEQGRRRAHNRALDRLHRRHASCRPT